MVQALRLLSIGLVIAFLPSASVAAKGKKRAPLLKETISVETLSKEATAVQVKALKKAVKMVKGVRTVAVRKAKSEVVVTHTKTANLEEVKAAIEGAGFPLMKPAADEDSEESDEDDFEGFDDEE